MVNPDTVLVKRKMDSATFRSSCVAQVDGRVRSRRGRNGFLPRQSALRHSSDGSVGDEAPRVAQWRKAAMSSDADDYRYFLTYSGVSLPLNLVSPLAANDLENRNTYFRALYDGEERLLSCEKIVYGEVELRHSYEYRVDGLLARALIAMGDDEETEDLFDESGRQIRA
jgi:hypothetical protein